MHTVRVADRNDSEYFALLGLMFIVIDANEPDTYNNFVCACASRETGEAIARALDSSSPPGVPVPART